MNSPTDTMVSDLIQPHEPIPVINNPDQTEGNNVVKEAITTTQRKTISNTPVVLVSMDKEAKCYYVVSDVYKDKDHLIEALANGEISDIDMDDEYKVAILYWDIDIDIPKPTISLK